MLHTLHSPTPTMTDHDWVTSAMADTTVAAEILVKLRVATLTLPSKRRRPPPPQSWTIHQRRSRTQPASNKSEAPTASPTTPLSWSGATSVSGSGVAPNPIADAVDSKPPNYNRSDFSRSKVSPPHETTIKRPRKKKTLAALKKEEVELMEEQYHLKRKLAALQANSEKQKKENERLRKIKDIQIEPQVERPKLTKNNQYEVVNDKIVLPDLNVPFGEEVIVSY